MSSKIKELGVAEIEQYVNVYNLRGSEGFFSHIVEQIVPLLKDNPSTDIESLDLAEAFFDLAKRTKKKEYFEIGKVLRRAAHVFYRRLFEIFKNKKINKRFLNRIQ